MGYTIIKREIKAKLGEGSLAAFCSKIEECEKTFRNEPPKPGVKFWWTIVTEDADENDLVVELPRHVTTSIGDKSNLRNDMVAVHGLKAWEKAAEASYKGDDTEVFRLIDATLGKDALLQITVSEDEKWNNIKGVIPMVKGMIAPRPSEEWLAEQKAKAAAEFEDKHKEDRTAYDSKHEDDEEEDNVPF